MLRSMKAKFSSQGNTKPKTSTTQPKDPPDSAPVTKPSKSVDPAPVSKQPSLNSASSSGLDHKPPVPSLSPETLQQQYAGIVEAGKLAVAKYTV